MSSVTDIERAIEGLPPAEFAKLCEWFANLDAKRWDEQFERDISDGKLDAFADEASRDLKQGRATARNQPR
jgi:hypothetical protein